MKIKLTCDSSADLSKELYESNNISVIPFTITLGDKDYRDGVDLTPQMIFDYVDKNKVLPKTAALNEFEYSEFFKKEVDGYDVLIHFSISSKISSTYNNALSASKNFSNVKVIDSMSLSSGIGLQLLYASDLIKAGKTADEIIELINERRKYVQISFATYKLDYLHKGGRCSSIQLLGANLLKIRPSIALIGGKMLMHKKYMGKFEKVCEEYLKDTLDEFNNYDNTRCIVTFPSSTEEILNLFRKYIKENTSFKNVIETYAGATVTSHCGEMTIGIIYYNNKI